MNKLAIYHLRFWISVGVGIAVFFLVPAHWPFIDRILVGWNIGVGLFLIMIYAWMTTLNSAQMCAKFIEEDEAAPVILAVVIAAALFSLFAIVMLLSTVKQVTGAARAAHFLLATLTVVDSWLLVPTMFTIHYADMFYSVESDKRPLTFPQTPSPVFWDFAYFSFTIAAACQTSDVCTNELSIRKAVIAHTIISFIFNASILGFAINVSAGLISGN